MKTKKKLKGSHQKWSTKENEDVPGSIVVYMWMHQSRELVARAVNLTKEIQKNAI